MRPLLAAAVTTLLAVAPFAEATADWKPPPFDPAHLTKAGYALVFDAEFNDFSAIDLSTAVDGKPGAKFYGRMFDVWGGAAQAASLENLKVEHGVLTISGRTISSVAPSPATPAGYVGTTFQGGAYFEARLAWNRNLVHPDFSHPIDNVDNWWPSFFSVPVEYFTERDQWPGKEPGYVHFVENDWFEAWTGDYYGATLHDWYGPKHCYGQSTALDYCHISNDGTSNAHPDDPAADGVATNQNRVSMGSRDRAGFHTVGALWVSAAHAPDGVGYVEFFFDGKSTGVWKSWKAGADRDTAPPVADALFAALDDDHSVIFVGAPRNVPLRVDWIRVWQIPGAESNPPVKPEPGFDGPR